MVEEWEKCNENVKLGMARGRPRLRPFWAAIGGRFATSHSWLEASQPMDGQNFPSSYERLPWDLIFISAEEEYCRMGD